MTRVTCNVSVSVDGFLAGPGQDLEHPLGEGGRRLHEWHFDTHELDEPIVTEWQQTPGAYVMGRNMFGPGRGAWDMQWRGWWGDDPPYHAPVFVLTHHARDPVPTQGGTTFYFVTEGLEAALARAADSAGARSVEIAGGASVVNAYLAAGAIDELHLHIAPVLLGRGERLFDGVAPELQLRPISASGSPNVTHVRYGIGEPSDQ